MMGFESVADLAANPPAENADDGPEVLMRQLEMYYYGVDHIDGRTVLAGKGGRRIPVYFTVTRLPDGLYLSSHLNLSDQERIEEMRRAAQAELARANRVATVGAFSASIAHELNQPIASMLIDTQTGLRLAGRESPDREALVRILQRVERTAQRVADIVQRTRDNIVAGRRMTTAIDLGRLARDTRDLLEQDLKRAEVDLVITCSGAVPLIEGDPVELQQVFVNLVNNAADAMRDQPGPRRITLEIATEAETVRVRVEDTGPGIPEEHIERLFDPFFTTKPTGIGMGLQICRSAVEAMGGRLTVSNLSGGGASFSFDLPLAADFPALG
jgi:C4-dicarboxylate-specific signal transduction histidine kinase